MTTEIEDAEIVETIEPVETSMVRRESGLAAQEERSVDEVLAQMEKVKQLMSAALTEGEHYGKIPGTDKPTLLQPGAQKLCFMFRLVPTFRADETSLGNEHREYRVTCQLHHAATGNNIGEGVGLCSTMESKYRWRKAERVCPECGADCIKRSKFEKDGDKGWYCYAKIGGCGTEFKSTDARIAEQETGRKENPDIADTYNTVLKMAKKRAFVDATLTATAASDILTQDLEEMAPPESEPKPETKAKATPKTKKKTEKTITADQKKELWDIAAKRGKKVEKPPETIMRDLLAHLGVEATAEIPAAKYDEAVALVERWDPEVQFG